MHSHSVRSGESISDVLMPQVSKMDNEKLIECVRSHPALYNLVNSKYLDTKYKNYLWRKIAVELSLNENDWVICKQRWTNIRDQYKKCLKSQKTSTGQAAKKIKLYKFYEQLQFLKGIDEDRDKIENFEERSEIMPSLPSDITQSISNDSDINQQSNSQSHKDVVASPSLTSFAISPAASSSSATNEQSEPTSDLPIQEPQRNPRLKKKKMSAPVPESASAALMKYVLMNKNKNTEHTEKEEQHPIDAFLQGLAPTLKSFSPYLQHLAKGQIFQVIHNLELQQLTENLTSSQSTPIILSSPSPSSPSVPVISSPLPASEHSGTSDSIQLSEQPGSSESIQLYFSQYDTAND